MRNSVSNRKRAHEVDAHDVGPPDKERVRRRRVGEAECAVAPRLYAVDAAETQPEGWLMSLPAELLDRIAALLSEEHLSCLLRASQPLYQAVQRSLQAVPASYVQGCLYRQAKWQRAETAVNLRSRQLLDARNGACRLATMHPAQRPGSLADYARGFGKRYPHVSALVDGPAARDIAIGLGSSAGWRHLELIAAAPRAGELPPFLDVLAAGLRAAAPAPRRELSLMLGGANSLADLAALASFLEPMTAQDALLKVSGMHLSAHMIAPLAAFFHANAGLQRLVLDLGDGRQTACALALLEHGNVQPAALVLRNVPSAMDYPRLSAALRARPALGCLCVHGKPTHARAVGLILADLLSGQGLRKLGLYRLRLDAANLAGLEQALAGATGLHTLKFVDCLFPDGLGPLIKGLAANRGIVRLALNDCLTGDANDGKAQIDVLAALHDNPALRQLRIDRYRSQAFWHAVAGLRQRRPELQYIFYDPDRFSAEPALE